MAIKIITDSAADLPQELIDKYQIHVIPIPVIVDGVEYLDGETIKANSFYDTLREGKDVKTCQINAFMFREHFEPYATSNDTVIYLSFSAGITGTYNSARLAKEELLEDYPDFDLEIVDSKSATIGLALLIHNVLKFMESNPTKEQLMDYINFNADHIEHIFTVDNLDYLFRGGRLSRTTALVGGVLNIKPIIEVTDEGTLEAFDRVRGRQKALKRCIEEVGVRGVNLTSQTIGICHGDDIETLQKVKQQLIDDYGCTDFIENYVGCAIGTHTGPGIIGMTFLNAEYNA